ncbi:xanthine dehydrogenase family protein molybdopterin-binding subunit [Solidesulfovibrio magneticus]|uniref:Xanthine dehydrogenase molybdenum binding subunit n=1 Tax=Solidesulfovibrio magneticus (strain ATCC 700980 / DSM 13731 / RS-1) TaxID=573370 RepID=C4XR84_SOLM1|nr:xanthine dehydrogenase family protein molybdopterin-binding subunit [Solidesulfovibrio magneticus]BAH75429.1 xanthine dehydrogenase molybdenum binding subunit [Solidesulfovibrio magneticus RS-1]
MRIDALDKACGRERYAVDETPPDCLWAGALRAGIPHGRITALDAARARETPGVVAVLTRADVPGTNRQGIVHKDQPVLCGNRVRHCGDAVSLVVAESRDALAQALSRIRLTLEPLPGVFDPAKALAPDAPLVHSGRDDGNLLARGLMEKGDAPAALARCAVVVEGRFETPMQEHAFLEPPNGLARLAPSGRLDLVVSTQAPFRDRFEIGQALGIDPQRIRVRAPYLGGGFGGKDGATVQCLLALAALRVPGRWIKMVWSREETFLAGYKRHRAVMDIRLGADADGTLAALECRMLFDVGPYAHLSAEIMALGMEHAAGPYRIPNTRVEGLCAYTNNPVGGAFRGFGVVQATFAMERAMDLLAGRLGRDPAGLRRQNALRAGEANGVGVSAEPGTDVAACLDAAMAHPLWAERKAWKMAAPPFIRRGVGLTAMHNGMGYGRGLPDHAAAKLELTRQGTFRLYNSVPDMGQGNAPTFAAMAAKALNQPQTAFTLLQPDTQRCPPAGSSSASRTTYTFGNALLGACRAMATKLRHRASLALLCDEPDRLVLVPGAVSDPATGRAVPLAVLAGFLSRDDRICIDQHTMAVVQNPPATGREFRFGFPHRFYAYGACLCGVEVDTLTGTARLVQCFLAVACGKVFSLEGVEQQLHGAAAQGAGLALYEDPVLQDGHMRAGDLCTYLLPTAADLPDMDCLALDDDEPTGPMGLKGMGEIAVHGPGPAVAQALQDAAGFFATRLPVSPEQVLAAMEDAFS